MAFHIFGFFQLFRLPLRLFGPAFHFGRTLRNPGKPFLIMLQSLFRQPAPQLLLDDTMDLQVRIAPYGGSKMTILLAGQAKMPIAFGAVFGLFHAPQRQPAYQHFFRRSFHLIQKLLYLLRVYLFPRSLDIIAEIMQKRG